MGGSVQERYYCTSIASAIPVACHGVRERNRIARIPFWEYALQLAAGHIQQGETLINCLAYIDLNPVRAGIVEKPEDYRWN